jgi:predicted enzyme related to lactoylglutathione lyase
MKTRMAEVQSAVAPVYGAPCWVSLATDDLESAQRFYGEVLGWSFHRGSLGENFTVAYSGDVPVAGMGAIVRSMGVAVQWTPFFSVPDADLAAARVRERSATVAVGPIRMGEGRTALAADLAGATFGFWEGEVLPAWDAGRSGPPARLELRTRDAFASAIFYAEVFDWASDTGRCEVDYQYEAVVVRVDGRAVATIRGGAVEQAPDPHIRPRWHASFFVDDVDDAAKAAVSAGGAIAMSPGDNPFGRTARLFDPEGGLFTVHSHASRGD